MLMDMFFRFPTPTRMAFTRALMDPHASQQHEGLQHAVWWLQQEVTRPNARFKPTLPEKSGVDGGLVANKSWSAYLNVCTSNYYLCLNAINKSFAQKQKKFNIESNLFFRNWESWDRDFVVSLTTLVSFARFKHVQKLPLFAEQDSLLKSLRLNRLFFECLKMFLFSFWLIRFPTNLILAKKTLKKLY